MKNFFKLAALGVLISSQVQSAAFAADEAIPMAIVQGNLKEYLPEEKVLIEADRRNIEDTSLRGKTVTKPHIYLSTAGGPGSMKSTILETFMKEDALGGEDFVYADPDVRGLKLMINTYIPATGPYAVSQSPEYARQAYEKWRGASNYVASSIINEAYKRGLNIAHGTTATAAAVTNLYKSLDKKHYRKVFLLCDTSDENRQASIRNREETQGFYQVTPEDAVEKSRAFYDRFPDYFRYGDQLYFYWTDDYKEGSIRAATFNKESGLTILNEEAFKKFKGQYERAQAQKPELPVFDVLVMKP